MAAEDPKLAAARARVESEVDAMVAKLGLQSKGFGLKVTWNKEEGGGCLALVKNTNTVTLTKENATFRQLLDSLRSFGAGYRLCRKLEVPA